MKSVKIKDYSYELKQEIFLENRVQFKNKVLILYHQIKSKQDYFTQQPCET